MKIVEDVANNTIIKIEAGKNQNPTLDTFRRIAKVSSNKRIIDGKEEKRFSVTYYYSVDWAHIKLTDSFPYSLEGIFDGITLEELQQELQRHLNAPIFQNKYQQIFYFHKFHKVKPISSIATKKTS